MRLKDSIIHLKVAYVGKLMMRMDVDLLIPIH